MFAIKCTEDNLDKILQTPNINASQERVLRNMYAKRDYMFIQGYITARGGVEDWALLPDFIFKDRFDFDPIKIQTDWDQIVYK